MDVRNAIERPWRLVVLLLSVVFSSLVVLSTHKEDSHLRWESFLSIRGKYSNACQDNQTTKEGANICQNKRQQRTSALGRKRNMVPITSLLNNTYHRLPLCLLYPSHPRSFPNQHSFPSNSLPPQTKVYGKASQEKKRWSWKGERHEWRRSVFFFDFIFSSAAFFLLILF